MSVAAFKNLSRLKAIELFPGAAEALKLKGSHNRAEALLICEWGRRNVLRKYIHGYQPVTEAAEVFDFRPIEYECENRSFDSRVEHVRST